jgi:hypothetical protein
MIALNPEIFPTIVMDEIEFCKWGASANQRPILNFAPRGKLSPQGARGEVKNGPQHQSDGGVPLLA